MRALLSFASVLLLAGGADALQLVEIPGLASVGAVSADGSIVVGQSTSGLAAFWTQGGGVQEIGAIPGDAVAVATEITPDGSAIAGFSKLNGGAFNKSFRWTAATGVVGLGVGAAPTEIPRSFPTGITDDGQVVSGFVAPGSPAVEGFLWTPSAGMETVGDVLAGWPAGGPSSAVISADGASVFGHSASHAARWTSGGGIELLVDPPGFSGTSFVEVAAADGSAAAGLLDGGDSIFHWTEATGMVDLGPFEGLLGLAVTAEDHAIGGISGDGQRFVGTAWNSTFFGTLFDGFVWDPDGGLRTLSAMLADEGVDLSGWDSLLPEDISRDGKVIVGRGERNGESTAFLVTVPESGAATLLCVAGAALGVARSRNRSARS